MASDQSGHVIPRAFIHYFFKSGKVSEVTIPSLGNSLNSKPYYCTQHSTIQSMQDSCSSKSVPLVYDELFEKDGGLDHSTSVSAEPRNRMQIYNVRKYVHNSGEKVGKKDELFDLLELLKRHQTDPTLGFLREVNFSSSPSAVLATQQQLENLVNFCCQPPKLSVLGVDAYL